MIALLALGTYFGAWRGGDHRPYRPGRIAVTTGCGLTHMWSDGTDVREQCLPDFWASASLSFDGRKLAWDTKASSAFGILVADADGKNEYVPQLPDGVNVEPTLSPDGKRLAFLHSPRDDGRYDVWSGPASATSDAAEQVTATHDVSEDAWSPTGEWIAYVTGWSPDTLEGDVVLVRPNGDDERRLGKGDAPAWAPDGEHLALVRNHDLWIVDLHGAGARRLVRNGLAPAWSRDGKEIAFMREETCGKPVCRMRLFVVSADGGPERAVGPTFPGQPSLLWLRDPFE